MHRTVIPVALLLIAACGEPPTRHTSAAGGKRYGGIFSTNETEPPRGFFPLEITQASVHRVAAQIYQGLVALDQSTLEVKPCLAESWGSDASHTEWTFHLRKGVRFHDDPAFPNGSGRELVADDVVNCFTAICTDDEHNQVYWLFQGRVQGADEYHEATRTGSPLPGGVSGITAVDAHTVRIRLTGPMPGFLFVLAHQGCWIWPRELRDHHGRDLSRHAIGTGPFRVNVIHPAEVIVLERNPNYWEKDEYDNALPLLDGVRVTYTTDKRKELEEFLQGRLTCLFEPPVEQLARLSDSLRSDGTSRFTQQSALAFSTQFYGFRLNKPPFDDPRVRAAFSMAVDRRTLVEQVLHGLAVPATKGLVPPGLHGYRYDLVADLRYDPDSARALLAAAGHPGGAGLPSVPLQVNTDGFGYVEVADAVQTMLRDVLGVSVSVSSLPSEQHYAMVDGGVALFWRQGWIADYPDPENFLALLYGRNAVLDSSQASVMNTSRYADPVFDSLYDLAQRSGDAAQRMRLMALAEQQAMSANVVMPLYHERSVRLLQPYVRDLPMNAMEYRDLGAVWFEK